MKTRVLRLVGALFDLTALLLFCALGVWPRDTTELTRATATHYDGLNIAHAVVGGRRATPLAVAPRRSFTATEQEMIAGMQAALSARKPISGAHPQPLAVGVRKFPAPPEPQLSAAQRKVLQKLEWGPVKELMFRGDAADGTVRTLASPALALGSPGGPDQAVKAVMSFTQTNKELFLLSNPAQELAVRAVDAIDGTGYVVRLQQRFQGLPVWPGEIIGNVSEAGALTVITGSYIPTPELASTKPAIEEAAAIGVAQVNADFPAAAQGFTSQASLVVFGDKGHVPELAYHVIMEGPGVRQSTFVSAVSGQVLLSYSEICDASATGSGVDLLGATRTLNVSTSGASYVLKDTSKSMYAPATGRGTISIYDAGDAPPANSLPASSFSLNGGYASAAVSAAYNLSQVYDFYATALGRTSFDNSGADIIAVVRARNADGSMLNNAYWNGRFLTFGSGDRYPAALDVVAHEFTHAVTESTAKLIYQGESGALNEGFSDIMGEACERYMTGTLDWVVGTSLLSRLRSLQDPPDFGQPASMSEYVSMTNDNGGVHTNSGIPNHVFYLLAEGLEGGGIGVAAARNIFYHALRTKLTSRATFYDLRTGCILAAGELYGEGGLQAQKTAQAFNAAEIYGAADPGEPQDLTPVNGADSYLIVYKAVDGNSYLGRHETERGDGVALTPIAREPVSSSTRVSITADGSTAVFVSTTHDLVAVGTDGSFDNSAGASGVFNSVSISADGRHLAGIARDASTGLPINKLFFVDRDDGASQVIDLVAPVMDGTSGLQLITVDEVDLSPDGQIALFDGFASTTLGDGTVAKGWSIFAVDLRTQSIFSLAGPYADFDIGNPSFGRLSSDRGLLEARGSTFSSVMAVDLRHGTVATVRSSSPGSSYYAYPRYSAADDFVVSTEDFFDFGTLSYQPRVSRISLLPDKITPVGSSSVVNGPAYSGVSYRRGVFAGPPVLTVSVLAGSISKGQSTAFRISRVSGDRAIRVPVSFKATGAARPGVDYDPIPLTINLPGDASFVDVLISAAAALNPGIRTVMMTLDRMSYYLVSGNGQAVLTITGPPEIVTAPENQFATEGGVAVFNVGSTSGGVTFQWYHDGVMLAAATTATLSVSSVQKASAGSYWCVLTNAAGSSTTSPVTLTVAPAAYLSNLSVRASLPAGGTLIAGFVVEGGVKPVLVRAAGPALNRYGLAGCPDPALKLFDASNALVGENDDWGATLAATFSDLGAFQFDAGSKDAAFMPSLNGPHTAHVTGASAGFVLVEAYDAGVNDGRTLTNVSARFHVGTGNGILIAGLVVAGTGSKQVLLRAVGPKLTAYGVTGVLSDPMLEVYDDGTLIASNDNWAAALAPTFAAVGAFGFEVGSKDAALVLNLVAGQPYTIQVSGVSGGSGEALVEVYALP